MKFENLKTSVLVWFGIVITVLLLVFSISFYYFFNKSIELSLKTKLQQEAFYFHDKILPKLKKSQIIRNSKFSSIEIAITKNKKIINQTKTLICIIWINFLKEVIFFYDRLWRKYKCILQVQL